jgi:hypothetical protein
MHFIVVCKTTNVTHLCVQLLSRIISTEILRHARTFEKKTDCMAVEACFREKQVACFFQNIKSMTKVESMRFDGVLSTLD